MRLGIDLDNTLICYDDLFLWGARELKLVVNDFEGGKIDIRTYLRQKPEGERSWQYLQGLVYGKWIGQAKLFQGAYRFLWRCRERGIEVQVLSHKSKFAPMDKEKIPLQDAALQFLTKAGVLSGNNSSLLSKVEFYLTREEKIRGIEENEFDWFIDDLVEIFKADQFPSQTAGILFDPSGNSRLPGVDLVTCWTEIEYRLLGEWGESELSKLTSEVSRQKVNKSVWHGGGGNAGLGSVELVDGQQLALKIYPDDDNHDRLYSEFEGLTMCRRYGVKKIAKPVDRCQRLNVATYRWIKGDPIVKPTIQDLEEVLGVLGNIHALRGISSFRSFPAASAAVFSGLELETQVKKRFELLQNRSLPSKSLNDYIENDFAPAMKELISWSRGNWPNQSTYREVLPVPERTLSPSDLGFHNTLKDNNGNIVLIDFEYFGWDDPGKLIGDFILHPGMALSEDMIKSWILGVSEIYGECVLPRVRAMWPLLGLCWCLILLNEFRRDIWIRRQQASSGPVENKDVVFDRQLNRSKKMLVQIQSGYEQFLL